MVIRRFVSHETLMEVYAAWSAFMSFYLSMAGGLAYAELVSHKTSSALLILGGALNGAGAVFFTKLGVGTTPPGPPESSPQPARTG